MIENALKHLLGEAKLKRLLLVPSPLRAEKPFGEAVPATKRMRELTRIRIVKEYAYKRRASKGF